MNVRTSFQHSNSNQKGFVCTHTYTQTHTDKNGNNVPFVSWQLISETGSPSLRLYTRGPDFTGSIRHYCVSNDELSVIGREGGGPWTVGETRRNQVWREKEEKAGRGRGTGCCHLGDTAEHHRGTAAAAGRRRTEHPSISFSSGKTRLPF